MVEGGGGCDSGGSDFGLVFVVMGGVGSGGSGGGWVGRFYRVGKSICFLGLFIFEKMMY